MLEKPKTSGKEVGVGFIKEKTAIKPLLNYNFQTKMDFVKLFLGLICLISMTDGAERCYACYSCNRVEPSSQSIQCEDYQNLCMVKASAYHWPINCS